MLRWTILLVTALVFSTSPWVQAQSLDLPVQATIVPGLGGASRASPQSGTLSTLTYNVAGIPQLISRSEPQINSALIGPLLNDFDLVLLQEDFLFHEELSADVAHPHRSMPSRDAPSVLSLGDGLNRFSRLAFDGFERETWRSCFGVVVAMSDCTATKGLSVARTALADGVEVDVYNVHLDAGDSPDDRAARRDQVEQLIEAVRERSAGRAVIVAGDTNLWRHADDESSLGRLTRALGLTDVCRELACGRERVDRVLYRSGNRLELRALEYDTPAQFVDAGGRALSDHRPVAVTFEWREMAERVADR